MVRKTAPQANETRGNMNTEAMNGYRETLDVGQLQPRLKASDAAVEKAKSVAQTHQPLLPPSEKDDDTTDPKRMQEKRATSGAAGSHETKDKTEKKHSEFSYLSGPLANLGVMRDALLEVQKRKACSELKDPGLESSTREPILGKKIAQYTSEERKLLRKAYAEHDECIDRLSAGAADEDQAEAQAEAKAKAEQGEHAHRFPQATSSNASKYAKPFCEFLTNNPTVFHAVSALKKQMKDSGWTELSERDEWNIEPNGHYFVERNGSSLTSFVVGANYKPGNGAAILAGHVDALTAKLKPVSKVPNKAGYLQLGVAPYAGGLNNTWWDRDLGIAGRVLIKEGDKIVTKLVDLNWPIARIPTLAPHFGAAAQGPFNQETQMVPIIGLENSDSDSDSFSTNSPTPTPESIGSSTPAKTFASTQPPALVSAIASQLSLSTTQIPNILNWELELYDVQPATTGGLNHELLYGGRIDDKLCSWAAQQALIESQVYDTRHSSLIKAVALFDDEEIGSLLRQGARGNFLPQTLERAVGSLAGADLRPDTMGRTYANSFLVSSDVTHAANPNFLGAYLDNHAPRLNTGLVVSCDSNGHMTTDAVSTTVLQQCARKVGAELQVFQIRNDSRSGGTVGPMLSSVMGVRAVDAGLPQLSMHSIRATTGALDPGLGVLAFTGFLNGFESVDREMRSS